MSDSVASPPFGLTPREIVARLDEHIIGQPEAKRAVAIALRNRWRRMQLPVELRQEVTPKNILMIGPTGVGKTEIARRLSHLADAPFIKVEATKFTEVGYVGRDVEQIIRDLIEIAVKRTREKAVTSVKLQAQLLAEERVLDALIAPGSIKKGSDRNSEENEETDITKPLVKTSATREFLRRKLLAGELDDKEIEVEVAGAGISSFEIMGPPGMEEMIGQLQHVIGSLGNRSGKLKRMKIKEALKRLQEDEANRLISEEEVRAQAMESVEQNGVVFLDEMDKIVGFQDRKEVGGPSREGVQRDLLPLVEGSTVSTKYGMVKTDHILFIGSGAFHLAKPSDLIPELQGRFPIRVELKSLTAHDFSRILTEPKASLTEQYTALLKTENYDIKFTEDGITRLAEIAFEVNNRSENIGARRLHTVLERLLDVISFEASDKQGQSVKIDAAYVNEQLQHIVKDEDLSRYIL